MLALVTHKAGRLCTLGVARMWLFRYQGNHTFLINLADTLMGFYGKRNDNIERAFQNGAMSSERNLISGGIYSLQFRCSDLFNNQDP